MLDVYEVSRDDTDEGLPDSMPPERLPRGKSMPQVERGGVNVENPRFTDQGGWKERGAIAFRLGVLLQRVALLAANRLRATGGGGRAGMSLAWGTHSEIQSLTGRKGSGATRIRSHGRCTCPTRFACSQGTFRRDSLRAFPAEVRSSRRSEWLRKDSREWI